MSMRDRILRNLRVALVTEIITMCLGLGVRADPAGGAGSGSAGSGDAGSLEEIVVTGLKRDVTLLEVPDAVSVFTGQYLERANITRPGDYLALVPNVTFYTSSNAGDSFINIRGQTSVRNSESSAAVVIDGVQLATSREFNGELFDIQQIEVFKGPQGALYGRNASAGAVVITTRAPTDDFEGHASAGYGDYNSSREVFALSGPVIPGVLRFRVDGVLRNTDGPYQNITTGEDMMRSTESAGRLRIDWLASDDLRVELRLNGSKLRAGGLQFNAQEAPPVTAPVCGVVSPAINANSTAVPFCSNILSANDQSITSTSIKIDYKTSFADFTSVTAYDQIAEIYQADNFPYVPDTGQPGALTQKYRIDNHSFTQEIRLGSKASRAFSWMVGAYYLDESKRFTQKLGEDLQGVISPNLGPDGLNTPYPTTSFFDDKFGTTDSAAFANAQYRPIDPVEIALAGRYDREKRSILDVTPDAVNPVTGTLYSAYSGDSASHTFDAFTPKATLTYLFDEQASVYASWGKGFKSGGYNPFGTRQALINAQVAAGGSASQVFVQDGYDKETSETSELGFKSRWLDNKLSVDGAIFKTDVRNGQQFEFFPSAGLQAIAEIDKIGIKGWELAVHATLLPGLEISAGYGAIKDIIKAFAAEPTLVGKTAPYAAKDNGTVALDYSAAVSTGLNFAGHVDVDRTGQIQYIVENYPGSARDPVTLVNGRLALRHDQVEVGVWGRNLNNKQYNVDVVPLLPFLQAVEKAWPRSFGADVSYKF